MTTVELQGLCQVKAKGRVYWYAWRGGPRIVAPYGTPEFAAEYAAHHGVVFRRRDDPWAEHDEHTAGSLGQA